MPLKSQIPNFLQAFSARFVYSPLTVLTEDFDYDLPRELVAQHPAADRDASRLLVLPRVSGQAEHRQFRDFPSLLAPGDLVVFNDSKVIPARLRGVKSTGGEVEFLLLEEVAPNEWWVMLRPAKRLHPGDSFRITDFSRQPTNLTGTLIEKNREGHCRLQFENCADILDVAARFGEMPLPPYIERAPGPSISEDRERYQTIFAEAPGSVAAPTAGLHFTPRIFDELNARGVRTTFVTLHVGAGTFAPVKVERVEEHRMHEERYFLSEETISLIHETKSRGGRVIPVGTTSLRVLESAARNHWQPGLHRTRIFIYPPFDFKVADALLTNFHLPKSTLLMLVSAFASPSSTAGREKILNAYSQAVHEKYRFFSYGDAMFVA